MNTESILKYFPLVTLAAFAAAIVYDAGAFATFGSIWISSLTIQDVFSISWSFIPLFATSSISVLAQIVFHEWSPKTVNFWDREWKKEGWTQDFFSIVFAVFLSIPVLFILITLVLQKPNVGLFSGAVYSRVTGELPLLGIVSILICPLTLSFLFPSRLSSRIRASFYVVLLYLVPYACGVAMASARMSDGSCSSIYLKSESISGEKILFFGERGLLITSGIYSPRLFISRDQVVKIYDGVSCRKSN